MAIPPVNLGYGAPTEVQIDQVNQWMRGQPWYQSLIRSFGQNPNSVHLNDSQKQAVVRAAQANGVIVDEGQQEVDDSGNFRNQGHKLRNTLMVAGIAGAALAAPYLIPAIAGAGGGGAAAGAGLAGIEGGSAGLSSGALAGLGTGAMGATAIPALGATGAGLASTAIGSGMVPAIAGGTSGAGMAAGTGGTLASILGYAKKGLDTYQQARQAMGGLGEDATALEAGRTAGRLQQAGLNSNQDQLRQRAAQMLNDALLAQTKFNMQAPRQEGQNSAYGDLLANVQDAGVSGPIVHTHGQIPQITGGLRPSLLSANTRQLGQNISRTALMRNMSGADNLDLAKNVPSPTPLPQGNAFDTTLNGLGLAGGLGGSVFDFINAIRRRSQPAVPNVPNYGPSGGTDTGDWQTEGIG